MGVGVRRSVRDGVGGRRGSVGDGSVCDGVIAGDAFEWLGCWGC